VVYEELTGTLENSISNRSIHCCISEARISSFTQPYSEKHHSIFNMMNKLFTAGTALLAVASALPSSPAKGSQPKSPAQPTYFAIDQEARFENAQGLPGVAAAPINIYLDIFWQGFALAISGGLQNIAGVIPQSPANAAVFSNTDVPTLLQGGAAMITTYDDSTVDHFDMKSFYYGCVLATKASIASVPISCTITIKGYYDNEATQLAGQQNYNFATKPLQTSQQMNYAVVPTSFRNLKRVNFEVSDSGLVAAVIDTVHYIVYQKSN
jgi:hypothetical protein